MKIRVGDGVTKLTADNPDLQFAGKGLLLLFLCIHSDRTNQKKIKN
jgi:hypothetical protein